MSDAEPSTIALVADRPASAISFCRLLTEFGIGDRLHIEVDVCGMPEEQLALIANKIAQFPSIHRTYRYPLF